MEERDQVAIEMFKKLRDICNDIVVAHENEDEQASEAAMGRFLMLMIELSAMK